jgi:hypothetical protein
MKKRYERRRFRRVNGIPAGFILFSFPPPLYSGPCSWKQGSPDRRWRRLKLVPTHTQTHTRPGPFRRDCRALYSRHSKTAGPLLMDR